jgi:hypothetical protein
MPRLFWTRPVSRVQRSLKVKTGQSTTSFPPETGNLITTSTTYSLYADHVTDVSKTGSFNESPGVTNDSNKGGRGKKGWVLKTLMAFNDLLPRSIRPIKSKRARRRAGYPIGVWVFTYRMLWRSHWKNQLKAKLRLNK